MSSADEIIELGFRIEDEGREHTLYTLNVNEPTPLQKTTLSVCLYNNGIQAMGMESITKVMIGGTQVNRIMLYFGGDLQMWRVKAAISIFSPNEKRYNPFESVN